MNVRNAPQKRARIALIGDDELASDLARELEPCGLQPYFAERAIGSFGRADLLVQLDRPAFVGTIDAVLENALKLGAERIVILRQGIPLANMPVGKTDYAETGIPISVVHLPTILTVAPRSAQGIARSILSPVWPVVFMSDVADMLAHMARDAGDGGLQATAPPRAGAATHALVMRLADILVGLSVLTVALPVLLGLALAIRRDSPGPAIFTQRRVGRGERPFTLFKFRTMAMGTRQAGTHEVANTSVTRLGAWLRHYKLDELPQAWNLLVGNLTLVGPRPCLQVQKELIRERRRRGVYKIKPGLTGLAQVRGIDMRDPVCLAEIDAAYAGVRGIALDLAVIARTFAGAGSGDRVAAAPPR